jgi:hypothetical protein
MSINLSEFIEYVKKIRSKLSKNGYSEILIKETIQTATKNWVDTSNPDISENQQFKITLSSLVKKGFNLN